MTHFACLTLYVISDTSNFLGFTGSLLGKQVHQVPTTLLGDIENVLVVCDAGQLNPKVFFYA